MNKSSDHHRPCIMYGQLTPPTAAVGFAGRDQPLQHVLPVGRYSSRTKLFIYVANSGRRRPSWYCRRCRIELCIWLTRLSERSSVAPISFMVSCS